MRLIAFTGPMGAGKSTAIEQLKDSQGKEVILSKFAAPLYKTQEYLYELVSPVYKRPFDFVKDRKLLQWLGTDWGRNLSESLWVDLWTKVTEDMLYNTNALVVCDDCRFDNEAIAIKNLGGVIIKIDSSNSHSRITTATNINHASEKGIDPKYIDLVVSNNGSLSDYQSSLYLAFGQLGLLDK